MRRSAPRGGCVAAGAGVLVEKRRGFGHHCLSEILDVADGYHRALARLGQEPELPLPAPVMRA